jgi:hypothetical protein
MPAAEKPIETKASIAAKWETAFGVARPRNDLMHAVQSANSTPTTTWDAAFKVHMPVACFPAMPSKMPASDRVILVSQEAPGVPAILHRSRLASAAPPS